MYRYNCQNCHEPFTGRKDRYKFCSQPCYQNNKLPKVRHCPVCSKEIPFKNKTFCSKKCSGFFKRTYSPSSKMGRRRVFQTRVCAVCEAEFPRGRYARKTCGASCAKIRKKTFDHNRYVKTVPDKEKAKIASKKYGKTAKAKARLKKWAVKNKTKIFVMKRKWSIKNANHRRNQKLVWRTKNPDKVKYYNSPKYQIDRILKEAAGMRSQLIAAMENKSAKQD